MRASNRALLDAAKGLLGMLPQPGSRGHDSYYARLEAHALHNAVSDHEAALRSGKLTLTRRPGDDEIVAVTLTDDEHRILAVLWERDQ